MPTSGRSPTGDRSAKICADLARRSRDRGPEIDQYRPFLDAREDTVVCIVEAMKVFNEIPAECRGKVLEILVEDQQPVDFGKPMIRVQPNN